MICRLFQFSVFILISMLTICVWMPQPASPLDSSSVNVGLSSASGRNAASSAAASGKYVQRGDWEPPDILLVVENSDWPETVETIVKASHEDGTPAFVLIEEDTGDENGMSLLNERRWPKTLQISHDTPWIRDYGPVQLKSAGNSVHWMDFEYGGNRPHDDSVPGKIAEQMGFPVEKSEYYLDGGAIISNGLGLCAMTDVSLYEASVDQSNIPEFKAFRSILGCEVLAVIPALTGESTGHADIIAQFLSPDTVAVATIDYDEFPDISAELDQAVESLLAAAHEAGQALRIIQLPMYVENEDFYSYVNGTRLKNSYLAPSFRNVPYETEIQAYRSLRAGLPGVALIPVPADYIVQKGGAVHCITLGINIPLFNNPLKYIARDSGFEPVKHISLSSYAMNVN